MKKVLTPIVLLFVFAVSANAQKLNFGGKAGANLTKISGQAFKDGFELGYHLGAFAEIDLSKKWGIQPEVLWNQTNTKRGGDFNTVLNLWQQNTNDIKLNYLSIPVLLRYNVAGLITLNLGPQFGILLNKNQSLWSNGKEAFKSGDLSLVGGATVNLKMLRVYGRYNIGLNNLNDVGTPENWKSQQLQLGVGFAF